MLFRFYWKTMKNVSSDRSYVYLIRKTKKYHLRIDLGILSIGVCQFVWHACISAMIFADMKETI